MGFEWVPRSLSLAGILSCLLASLSCLSAKSLSSSSFHSAMQCAVKPPLLLTPGWWRWSEILQAREVGWRHWYKKGLKLQPIFTGLILLIYLKDSRADQLKAWWWKRGFSRACRGRGQPDPWIKYGFTEIKGQMAYLSPKIQTHINK